MTTSLPVSWRRLVLFSLSFVILTGIGLYSVYGQFAERELTFDTRLLQPWVLTTLFGLLVAYYVTDALRLGFTLQALGHRIPFRKLLSLVFINLFFSNVTPMATGGGFAQIWYLRRHGVPFGHATAATTLRTLLAVAFIFTLAPLSLLTLDVFNGGLLKRDIGVALAVFVCLYLGFFTLVLFRTRWLITLLSRLLLRLHRWHWLNARRHRHWQFHMRREMLRFARAFREYGSGNRWAVVGSIVFTAGFLLSLFSFPALLLWGLGYSVNYLNVLGLLVVTTFIMYFSPTPGASGISEGVFGHFFRALVGGPHLLLVTVAWRTLTIYLGMVIGLILFKRALANSLLSNHSRTS
ncbi:flippase-like domain-containing protein [Marinimicrobium sp. C6131]|uniref:lysylphosphatidylglycerol synthase transmembrane domain-containing protein n=1 Tax=Marinimicrobium sp. C6131 TaxID=3022676 RepID=UPI00223D25AC|nr:lysylphosphatidylglycerol synthase transmembrane domain-containing protein [Marinimicrobium sp. C6131]UZJ45859.1 flippase-like domain-containing protein [Marinimicrobium sp. C6131]